MKSHGTVQPIESLSSADCLARGVSMSTTFAANLAVIIPTRNRLELLDRCLTSLAGQTFPMANCQVLVCDDGSTEELDPVVDRFRDQLPQLRLLRQPPRGPATARNMGIRASEVEILVCLDSDVVCAPDFLVRLIEGLRSHPDWLAAEACIKPAEGEESPLWDAPDCQAGRRYHTAAMAYRRNALMNAGGFDETFKLAACEDVELAARLLKHGVIGFVPEAVVFHPRRRVSFRTYWFWRRHWRYVMVLAKRYGFLAFPEHPAGPLPRLRVALAAVLTLPAGRFLKGLKYSADHVYDGMAACVHSLFDLLCGVCALPSILFGRVSPRLDYLKEGEPSIETSSQCRPEEVP
jgi:GT2 family glycosyltransferase